MKDRDLSSAPAKTGAQFKNKTVLKNWPHLHCLLIHCRSIANIIRHERFMEDGNMFYFDVTIVKVRTPFYITSKVKPIQMAKRGFDPEGKTLMYDDKPYLYDLEHAF